MGRYTVVKKPEPKKPEIHPIWRGIGFALMIILPLISYAGAMLIMQQNKAQGWVQIPAKLIIPANIPILGKYPDALVILFITIVIWVVLFALFQLFNFIIFSLFGPPRYADTDAPPITKRRRNAWRR